MASLGMKTGLSSLKCTHLHFSLYICRLVVSWETTMQEFTRRAHHTLFYIYNNFFLFLICWKGIYHPEIHFCVFNFQFNRTNTLNVIKIGYVVFFHWQMLMRIWGVSCLFVFYCNDELFTWIKASSIEMLRGWRT